MLSLPFLVCFWRNIQLSLVCLLFVHAFTVFDLHLFRAVCELAFEKGMCYVIERAGVALLSVRSLNHVGEEYALSPSYCMFSTEHFACTINY